MNKTLRNLLIVPAMVTSSVSFAGAIGLQTSAGLHQDRAYFYSQSGEQGLDNQSRPNYGLGFETLLGDKDEKVQGVLKISLIQDAPLKEPDTGDTNNAVYPAEHEQSARSVGVLGLGIQWGVLGDPSGTQMNVTSFVGSGFLTTDNTEFVLIEAGVGGTHNLSETLQLAGTLAATMRYRKGASFGPNAYLGIRYLFD